MDVAPDGGTLSTRQLGGTDTWIRRFPPPRPTAAALRGACRHTAIGPTTRADRRPRHCGARDRRGLAWFEFRELRDGPRSQNDYIELHIPTTRFSLPTSPNSPRLTRTRRADSSRRSTSSTTRRGWWCRSGGAGGAYRASDCARPNAPRPPRRNADPALPAGQHRPRSKPAQPWHNSRMKTAAEFKIHYRQVLDPGGKNRGAFAEFADSARSACTAP